MKVPLHQRIFNWGFYAVVGYCALGAILSATTNVIRVISPSVSIPFAVLALVIWASIEFYLKKRSVLWINEGGEPLRVSKLGPQRRLGFLGSIVLLLVPFLVAKFSKEQIEPKNRPVIGVKMYGVERKQPGDTDATKIAKEKLRDDDYQPIVYSDIEELVDAILTRLDQNHAIRELTLFGYGRPGLFNTGNGQTPRYRDLTYLSPAVLDKEQWQSHSLN